MEHFIIHINDEPYAVHYKQFNGWSKCFQGEVYPLIIFDDGQTVYLKKDTYEPASDFEPQGYNIMFEWNLNWRGVWDSRIYPKHEEYFASDIQQMADIWANIEPVIMNKIKDLHPGFDFYE